MSNETATTPPESITAQEIFDIVYSGLKARGFTRAVDGGGQCQYLAPNGNRCAAGLVFEKFDYVPAENVSVSWLEIDPKFPQALKGRVPLIRRLQLAHDRNPTPYGMRNAILATGRCEGLKVPE